MRTRPRTRRPISSAKKRLRTRSEAQLRSFRHEVTAFLEAGSDINADSPYGETYLHTAVVAGDAESTELLLAKGADIDLKNRHGETALHLAAKLDGKMVELLLNHGANPNVASNDGSTPLHIAAGEGNLEGVVKLLHARANASVPDAEGLHPIHLAERLPSPEVVALLRDYPTT